MFFVFLHFCCYSYGYGLIRYQSIRPYGIGEPTGECTMNAIANLSANLSANTIADHQLITLTAKQQKQIQIIRESANVGDLLDVATSRDKSLAGMVLSQIATSKMQELINTYLTTGNPSGLVRWVNLQIGTTPVPQMPSKKAELLGYESTIRAWVKYNTKGEPNTEKSQAARARAVAWMTPIFAAISEANTVTDKQASLQG